jgi:hypothetical protein
VVRGWKESYLNNYDRSSAHCASGGTLALAPGNAIGCERRGPSHGPIELSVAGGSASGNTGAGGVRIGGVGGVDATGAGGDSQADTGQE